MRAWIAIPTLGAACAGAVVGLAALRGLAVDPLLAISAGIAGAAIAACVRALLAVDAPATLAAMVIAPLLALATLFELELAAPRELIAIAAAAWTCVELARPQPVSLLVALLPAAIAMIDPVFVALLPIAGARVMTAPDRPRWALAIPIATALAALVRLGASWTVGHAIGPAAYAALVATALGPLMATAALGGLVALVRWRHAELALVASILLACVLGVRDAAVGASLVALAALSAGLAVGRLAASIRLAPGQAFAGATAGAVLLLAPAWSVIVR